MMAAKPTKPELLVDHECASCRHKWTSPFVRETVYCTRCYGGRVVSGIPYDPDETDDETVTSPQFEAAFAAIFKEGK
jgi:hypothetical protein